MKTGKIWGITQSVFRNESFQVHRIKIKKGGYCSLHNHKYRANLFFIEKGKLEIVVKKSDYDLTEKTILRTGEKMAVNPGDYHKFYAIKKTIAYEIYYPLPVSDSDIERKNIGGKK